jgi:hypothetical protein
MFIPETHSTELHTGGYLRFITITGKILLLVDYWSLSVLLVLSSSAPSASSVLSTYAPSVSSIM